MRAWEFLQERDLREPEITLRGLNRRKHKEQRKQAELEQRLPLIRVMYGQPELEQQQLDLERSRLELAKLKAEIEVLLSDCEAGKKTAVTDMAKSGSKSIDKIQQRIEKMARSEMRRRKKA